MADSDTPKFQPNPDDLKRIPIDLFVSKKLPGLSSGDLGFADSSKNLVFILRKSSSSLKSLLDSSGAPLFSISRLHNGIWELHKGDVEKRKDLVLMVKRTSNKFNKTELEVSFAGNVAEESSQHLVIKGSPFQKSCTIYSQDSIVAQTSLMYKLRQIYVGRSKFRLTIFPGSIDHSLVVAMVAVFLQG
ncbi:Protein LURP-one-related 7 [Cardamine amara subsp. amara]|uniref:Protein LURP-one-related 7 n=1 Tax=Cardamine amara subsp. amara TaxID=228776 RepID=A0ABD0ZE45_CARAN